MQRVTLDADDVSCYIRIVDSTTFLPEEGVTSATAGLALWYKKGATGAETALAAGDLANDEAAHADGSFAHVNDGYYRVDLPDAAIPTVENQVTTVGGTATSMMVLGTALIGVQPIGAPVALDGGTASIAGMLTKMADDNGGADFDAGTDSLQELRDRGDAAWLTATGFATAAKVLNYVRLLARKDAACAADLAAEVTEINANTGTGAGAYASTTDSNEATRDRGDSAWITATGFEASGAAAAVVGAAGANLTALGDTRLANLDAAVSTRGTGVALTSQQVRDAMKLAPTAGAADAGSVDTHLDDVLADSNELQTDWHEGGRLDMILDSAGAAGDPWATNLPGAYTGSQAGYLVGTTLATNISTLLTRLSAARAGYLDYLAGWTTTIYAQIQALIWTHTSRTLTQGAASVTAAVTGSDVTVYRGTRWEVTLTGLTDFTGYSKILFAVKNHESDADTESVVMIQKSTAGTGDGLLYLNGAAGTAAQGSIVVNSTTSISIYLETAAADDVSLSATRVYGVKWIDGDGHAHLASIGGKWAVSADIPKAIS